MKIEIRKGTVLQMASWLQSARDTGARDEAELRRILSLPDYQVEYARYGDPNLPTCGITPEESVDFFLHFDEKSFDNPRLEYKKVSFLEFYRDFTTGWNSFPFWMPSPMTTLRWCSLF